MQFQVPQFIDVEDKIVGPLTIKQFLFTVGGIGLAYIFYRFIPWLIIALIPMAASLALGAALAFYKFNGKPFAFIIEAGLRYAKSVRQYVWRRTAKKDDIGINFTSFEPAHQRINMPLASTTSSKLNDMTWAIDMNQGEIETQKVHSDIV